MRKHNKKFVRYSRRNVSRNEIRTDPFTFDDIPFVDPDETYP